ncbi:hypothetical protein ACHAWO_009313 [Cyclotella atomus]|uniref:Sulfotransferase domain-containing protein n=1 Tax=Cyclotella atomus TaxID=382360 RepID=A0ABD3MNI1_9STRA
MTDYPPMPLLPISSLTTIDAQDRVNPALASFGTTWTQHIVLSLLLAERRYAKTSSSGIGSEPDLNYSHVSEYAPFFEIDAHWDHATNSLTKSIQTNHGKLNKRVFNTHLRWDMLPKNSSSSGTNNLQTKRPDCGKFIYITRNLLDVCSSFYHHLSNQSEGRYEHDFYTFAKDWMDGNVAFGSALHHLLSFAEGFGDNHYACGDKNATTASKKCSNGAEESPLLLLSYERMKNNLRTEVLRIMEFLQLSNIPMDALENELLPSFEFQCMKKDLDRFQPRSVTWLNGFTFLRRGESGDGKRMMAEAVLEEDGKTAKLLSEYDEWVEREGYRKKIKGLLLNGGKSGDLAMGQVREIFINVVNHH